MADDYYIFHEGKETGPLPFQQVLEMRPAIDTQISKTGAGDWQYASELPEFYSYFVSLGIYLPMGDNLASFGWRLLAYVIDYAILSVALNYIFKILAMNGIVFKLTSYGDLKAMPLRDLLLLQLITSSTLIIYNTLCEASAMNGSLGKKLLKLVVVDINGKGIGFLMALTRSVGKAVSILLLYTGFLNIFFSQYKQAVHDLLAKTYVVKL